MTTSKQLLPISLVLAVLLALFSSNTSYAAGPICTVDHSGGANYTSISAAVTDTGCTTIQVAAGTYFENVVIARNLSIEGAGAGTTTVNGGGAGSVFQVNSSTVSLSDLTITGGKSVNGGGIKNFGTLTVNNSTISGNSATTGVGNANGGGIYNNVGSTTVNNSTISGNSATGGGNGNGGGIYNNTGGSTMVNNSTISGNSATNGSGGGINNNSGSVTVSNSTISGNSAAVGFQGGGIKNFGTLTVNNSTISGNSATNGSGGGIYNIVGNTTVSNSTINGNGAAIGGGVYNNSGSVTVSNSIIANSLSGGDCFNSATATLVNGGYNLVKNGSCFSGGTNLSGDPLLYALANNGGPTLTHALFATSPAKDTIPSGVNGCGTTLTSDQRGLSRPFPAGGSCDIGAFEFGTPPDGDSDGVPDTSDNCPAVANPGQLNTDGDTLGDACDPDDDGDGVADSDDAFPLDAGESVDTDGDGTGNNADTDDDGDGVADSDDAFPLDASESVDTDHDGMGNNADVDDDNDGTADTADAFPLNASESTDTDHDGMGNNADLDDDGDGVPDTNDGFPLNASESVDTDGDGTGNNADPDDDGDGVVDTADAFPLDAGESADTDGDGTGDSADIDNDGDNVEDNSDNCPLVANSDQADTDGDHVGDACELDNNLPTIEGTRTPVANANGWNNSDVIVSFTCSDGDSGLARCTDPVTLSAEGANQSVNGTAMDTAGNNASTTVSNINIDKTAPTVSLNVATQYLLGSQSPAPTCTATDNLSGFQGAVTAVTVARAPLLFLPAIISTTGGNRINELQPAPADALAAGVVTGPYCAITGFNTATIGTRSVTATATDLAGNVGSTSASYTVVYPFSGFLQPVDNLPVLNQVKAGSAIPVKFSLGGNQGLNIMAAGYPKSQAIACETTAPVNDVEVTVSAGGSGLSYNAAANQYTYVWKTEKSWSGCRQLIVKLSDDTEQKANFLFSK